MPLQALNHLADYGAGDTRPQLFICANNGIRERWVLKLIGLSPAELAADWIGSRLARRVDVTVPDVEIANVSAEALRTAPRDVQAWARPGPAFASREVPFAHSGLRDADMIRFPPEVLGAMYAVDAWLEVLDRRKPDGIWNVIENLEDGSLCVLDFGKGLSSCLQIIIGAADDLVALGYPISVRTMISRGAVSRACDTIEAVAQEQVARIVAGVPGAWISEPQRAATVRFLVDRAPKVRDFCKQTLG